MKAFAAAAIFGAIVLVLLTEASSVALAFGPARQGTSYAVWVSL
jgi:hypothetical protein